MGKEKRLRDKKVQVFVSEEEKEIVRQNASLNNQNISEYMRAECVHGIIIKRDFSDVLEELQPIGLKINDIATRVNIQEKVTEKDVEDLRKEYENMLELALRKIINR